MTVAEDKSCINCEEVMDCGHINRILTDYCKIELLKELTRNKPQENLCPNFSFIAISGEVLKRKLDHLIEISRKRKDELKRSKNKV